MGVDGEEEGEAESGRGEERLCKNAEDRPATAAAAVRAAPRKKRDMAGARGGEEVGGSCRFVRSRFWLLRSGA